MEHQENEQKNELKEYKKIAIMGGTFDPIHYGHLVTGEAVCHAFSLDKVLFMPTGKPAHKEEFSKNFHRYHMTELAIQDNENFKLSTIELDRAGTTYTIDTILELKGMCCEGAEIYFIMGADSLHQLFSWKEAKRLIEICSFIVVTRPQYDRKQLDLEINRLKNEYQANIHTLEIPALDISSSDIRQKIKKGEPIRYLLPKKVEQYIHTFELYKITPEDSSFISIQIKLQARLSKKRFLHTLGVVKEAKQMAKLYGVDEDKACMAALLHDCAKELSKPLRKQLCRGFGICKEEIFQEAGGLIHPFLGAELAKEEYGILDEDILNAIRYHTTGRANMSDLEKIVYIADYIEENRSPFEGLEEARRLAFLDLNQTMLLILEQTMTFLDEKGVIHPLSQASLDYFKEELFRY